MKIEAHENVINNTPLFCETCEYQCFTSTTLHRHRESRHPETLPLKAEKKSNQTTTSRLQKRLKVVETAKANPTWTILKISKFVGIGPEAASRVLKRHRNNISLERRKETANRPRAPRAVDIEKKIVNSIQEDPSLSMRQRAAKLGVGHSSIARVAKKIGFKAEVDESMRVYLCKLCPAKYTRSTTLTSHVNLKHPHSDM